MSHKEIKFSDLNSNIITHNEIKALLQIMKDNYDLFTCDITITNNRQHNQAELVKALNENSYNIFYNDYGGFSFKSIKNYLDYM